MPYRKKIRMGILSRMQIFWHLFSALLGGSSSRNSTYPSPTTQQRPLQEKPKNSEKILAWYNITRQKSLVIESGWLHFHSPEPTVRLVKDLRLSAEKSRVYVGTATFSSLGGHTQFCHKTRQKDPSFPCLCFEASDLHFWSVLTLEEDCLQWLLSIFESNIATLMEIFSQIPCCIEVIAHTTALKVQTNPTILVPSVLIFSK